MTFLKIAAAGLFAALSLLFGSHVSQPQQTPQPQFGSTFTPAQIPQTYLSGGGVTSSATSITLSSLQTRDGRLVTMSMFGSIAYGDLEPGTSKEEIISWSGITQNANGTATLTGVSRGLDFVSPYAASTTLAKSHAGNATFIVSNVAPFYGQQFVFTNNPSTVQAVITFGSTTPPAYDFNPVFASLASTTFASKGYVDASSINGGSPGNFTTAGLFMLASSTNAASSTGTGVFNAITYNRALSSAYATDTPQNCNNYPAIGGCIVMSLLNGKLNQSWLDLTQSFTFTGLHTYNTGGFIDNASSTFTATSSFAASNVNSNALVLRGISYAAPAAQASASSSILENDGLGNWSWEPSPVIVSDGTIRGTNANASTTLYSVSIPAGMMGKISGIEVTALATTSEPSGGQWEIDIGNGSASTSVAYATTANPNKSAMLQVRTFNLNSQSIQESFSLSSAQATAGAYSSPAELVYSTQTAINTANQWYVSFIAKATNEGQQAGFDGVSVRLIYQ